LAMVRLCFGLTHVLPYPFSKTQEFTAEKAAE